MFKHLLRTMTMVPFAFLAMPLFAQNPVVVENPADIAKALGVQKPFTLPISCINRLGPNNVCSSQNVTVPAGVRMVVKTISYRCNHPSTMSLTQFAIVHTISGSLLEMFLDPASPKFFSTSPYSQSVTASTMPVETYFSIFSI